MEKIMAKLEKILDKYLMPFSDILSSNKVITAVKEGMMSTLGVTLIASVALIISCFPFMDKYFPEVDAALKTFFIPINAATLGLIALYTLIGTAYSYSKLKEIEPLYGIVTALACFLIVTPFTTTTTGTVNGESVADVIVNDVIATGKLGAVGIFPALLVTILSISIFAYLQKKNITIKLPSAVPPNVTQPFLAMIPMGASVLVFMAVRLIFQATPFGTLDRFIDTIITQPFLKVGNNIWVFMFLLFIAQILWFFGIHGTNLIITAIWQPIALVAMTANLEAFNAGSPLPYALTAAFMCYTGQAKLSEIVALVLFGKSKRAKAIGKTILVPALFNIHEPFVFGLPVILNATLMIPWLIVESLQAGLAYFLMTLTGAVPIFQAPWTTPPILQQLIATNFNPWSVVICIATFVLGFVLWVPFIKILDKQYLEEEAAQEVQAA